LKKTSDSTDSQVLKADAYHYLTDIISNSAVIIVFIAALWWDGVWLDVIISFFIGIIILLTAKTLFVDSFRVLTDHELSVEDIEKISSLLNSSKEISGWHSLRTRKAGSRRYIDAHLEFTPTISLKEAHTKADKIELEIKKILNNVYIALHFDTEDDSKKEQNL
jgi:cation diffusion facilitator family transporter